jgi:uncharacterized membrane protein YcaP (DUF421 family)
LKKELISADELRSQARQQGIADVAEVEAAYLESNGEISFIKKTVAEKAKGKRRRSKAMGRCRVLDAAAV